MCRKLTTSFEIMQYLRSRLYNLKYNSPSRLSLLLEKRIIVFIYFYYIQANVTIYVPVLFAENVSSRLVAQFYVRMLPLAIHQSSCHAVVCHLPKPPWILSYSQIGNRFSSDLFHQDSIRSNYLNFSNFIQRFICFDLFKNCDNFLSLNKI